MPEAEGTMLTDTTQGTGADDKGATGDAGTTKGSDTNQNPDTKKTDDGKGADDKTTGETKAAVVPEKYDLKLPDDSPLQDTDVSATAEMAKSLGLTQENAQKLLEARHQDRVAFMESQQEFLKGQVKSWGEAVAKDPEIAGKGGDEFKGNVASAKLAINKFGSPELIKALNTTGLGNHPELVRMMVRIGKAMREGNFHTGTDTAGGDPETQRLNKFYKQEK